MKRSTRDLEQGTGAKGLSAGSGGSRAPAEPYRSSYDKATDRAQSAVKRSMDERGGGYPTRNGVQMKTKMQERMDRRKALQGEPQFSKGGKVSKNPYAK